MTENYAGDFPFWLAPEQIRAAGHPVQPTQASLQQLTDVGVRATIDRSGERLGKLIRIGEQMKIPVLGVIGAKESEQQSVSLRSRRDGDLDIVTAIRLVEASGRAGRERLSGLELDPA